MAKRNAITNFSYRSSTENFWRCPRAGYLEQHYLGTGIVKSPQAYWLSVGSAVHLGLAMFLEMVLDNQNRGVYSDAYNMPDESQALDAVGGKVGTNGALDYWDTCGQSD